MGATEKKFYRIRLAGNCQTNSKIVNGLALTKQWQVKVGDIGDFAKFPDVEAQVVVKQGNGFVPAGEAPGGATNADSGVSGYSSGFASTPAKDAEEARTGTTPPDFNGMTVEQLKNFLTAKGVAQSELRNAAKADLIERAEFIWSQN
jgi:hypothetical protein